MKKHLLLATGGRRRFQASLRTTLLTLFLTWAGISLRAEPLELAGPAEPAPAPAASTATATTMAAPAGTATTPAAASAAKTPATTSEIEITADNMDMDFAAHISTLTGHVVVTESRMKLQADKMIVHFGTDERPERIEALGNVTIEQPDVNRKAKAGRAEYTVAKGMIELTDKPSLSMGGDTMTGAAKITYYRDEDRVSFDSAKTPDGVRPTLTITPKSEVKIPDVLSGGKDVLGGGKEKDGK